MPSIFISGSNRGIGLELVRQYAAAGWRVYAACRTPDAAPELAQLAAEFTAGLTEPAGQVSVHRLDVNDAGQRAALVAELAGAPLDILFNNAGVSGGWGNQSFGSTDVAAWEQTLLSNVIAPLKMMEALVDNVAASEHKMMANMSSKMGSMADNGSGGAYLYRSSKAALNAVCVSAARDLALRGIHVVALHPGWVRTDMGGAGGELSVAESASALRRNLAAVTAADSGRFIDIDGSTIAW